MSNYSPELAAHTYSFTAGGQIAAGDPLQMSGNMTVIRCTGLTPPYAGIAATDAKPGQQITVHLAGPIHTGLAAGPIAAGDPLLASNIAGRQVRTAPMPGAADAVTGFDVLIAAALIGLALTSAADGQPVTWLSVH